MERTAENMGRQEMHAKHTHKHEENTIRQPLLWIAIAAVVVVVRILFTTANNETNKKKYK